MLEYETIGPTIFAHPLHEAVVRVLAYYDLFGYPLKSDEIYTYLQAADVTEFELYQGLPELVADGSIATSDGFYYLPHRTVAVVERRLAMERRGVPMWRIARRVASLIRNTPFVRGVFISGQLCRYIADEESDIDYFIVTEPNRLWIVRTLFVLARRTLLFNSRKYFCTNYYVTTDNLEIRERNLYVACEVASLKPMYNRGLYEQFIEENGWIAEYYPHYAGERIEYREGVGGRTLLQRVLEGMIPTALAERLDLMLMERTREFWRRKFPGRSNDIYEKSFRTRRNESRVHPHDQSPLVLTKYQERLHEYGIYDD